MFFSLQEKKRSLAYTVALNLPKGYCRLPGTVELLIDMSHSIMLRDNITFFFLIYWLRSDLMANQTVYRWAANE